MKKLTLVLVCVFASLSALRATADDNLPPQHFVLQAPSSGHVRGRFGEKRYDQVHAGIDWSCAGDETIKAAADGTVLFSGMAQTDAGKRAGIQVRIVHEKINGVTTTRYFHLGSVSVKMGDVVKAGDPIGVCGNGVFRSDAPHVHFEVLDQDKKPVDPCRFMKCN